MSIKKLSALLLVCILLCGCVLTGCYNKNATDPSVLAEKAVNTIAVTVGDYEINAVELNYYYIEVINSFCNEYGYYISYVLDVNSPLNEQIFDEETNMSWADYFMELAISNLKGTYLLYDAAVKAGMTLSDKDEAAVQAVAESIRYYAEYYEFDSVEAYMIDLFGYGADLESYCDYYRTNLLADSYYTARYESMEFSTDELAAYEAKNPTSYNSYSYAYYTVHSAKYLSGGREDENGNVEYTDAQQAQALLAAEADADALAAGIYANAEAFNTAIAALDVNSSLSSVSCTEKTDLLYAEVTSDLREWICDANRVKGDTAVIAKTTGSGDDAVTEGYYVVLFLGANDNRFTMKNVRHILVEFEGEAEEAKTAALSNANDLLEQWLSAGSTEEGFAELANQESDDGDGTTGGLYENVYPGQMVSAFEAWCYDHARQPGDYGIIETEYGYHIMYFVDDSEMTYRDYMILIDLRGATISTWYAEQLEAFKLDIQTLDYAPLDMVLYS